MTCTVVSNCARTAYHRGAHTAHPAPYTLAWDREDTAARALSALDFATPHWADLND